LQKEGYTTRESIAMMPITSFTDSYLLSIGIHSALAREMIMQIRLVSTWLGAELAKKGVHAAYIALCEKVIIHEWSRTDKALFASLLPSDLVSIRGICARHVLESLQQLHRDVNGVQKPATVKADAPVAATAAAPPNTEVASAPAPAPNVIDTNATVSAPCTATTEDSGSPPLTASTTIEPFAESPPALICSPKTDSKTPVPDGTPVVIMSESAPQQDEQRVAAAQLGSDLAQPGVPLGTTDAVAPTAQNDSAGSALVQNPAHDGEKVESENEEAGGERDSGTWEHL